MQASLNEGQGNEHPTNSGSFLGRKHILERRCKSSRLHLLNARQTPCFFFQIMQEPNQSSAPEISDELTGTLLKTLISLFREIGDYEVHGDKQDTVLVTLRNDLPKRIRLKLEGVIERIQSEAPGRISYIKSVGDFEALTHRKASFL